ncbi:hypothetical protein PIB30_069841 [Stylosanthes scabra]|uniref:Uncharacterized protein n=1 Tax=Stylosanthes scabra TaxID=79078 RepID=A0ABU6ZM08_9FABA|nr:hypothetical protein [Stylosanthes scabra]
MELEVRELRKENAELRSNTRNPQPRGQTSPRRRSRGDDTTTVRATMTPPREGIATHDGGPTGDTKEPKIGVLPRPLTDTLHSQVGF